MKIMTCQLTSGAASSLGRRILAWLTAVFLLASAMAQAAPLADLTGGQTGRIEFQSSTPDHRFAMVRNRLGPSLTIFGDLLMPPQPAGGARPAPRYAGAPAAAAP